MSHRGTTSEKHVWLALKANPGMTRPQILRALPEISATDSAMSAALSRLKEKELAEITNGDSKPSRWVALGKEFPEEERVRVDRGYDFRPLIEHWR